MPLFARNYYGRTIDQIYGQLCKDLIVSGDRVGGTLELTNVSFVLQHPENSFVTLRDTPIEYALGELFWYGAGDNSVNFISSFGSMWKRLTDDGSTNNSAYGHIIRNKFDFNQIEQVIDQLTQDPSSRRAKININTPNENSITTRDEPCTLTLQFLLRNGKLYMTTMMRSNDIWFGLPYDVLYFTTLQKYIAEELGVELGEYCHFATSLHVYDRNLTDIVDAYKSTPKHYKLNDLHNLLKYDMVKPVYDDFKNVNHSKRKGLVEEYALKCGASIEVYE